MVTGVNLAIEVEHAHLFCRYVDSSEDRLRSERGSITNAPFQSPNCHLLPQYFFFLLNKICDGRSSKEPFLKAATLSIFIWAYPREMKTKNGNFKNAAISLRKIAQV